VNTQISSKFAALAVALMMNSLIIGGIASLFSGAIKQHTAVAGLVQAGAPVSTVRV
jgi:hypothetical protein